MSEEFKTTWERIDNHTDRLKVPGGWVVRSSLSGPMPQGAAVHQLFVNDHEHRWCLDKDPALCKEIDEPREPEEEKIEPFRGAIRAGMHFIMYGPKDQYHVVVTKVQEGGLAIKQVHYSVIPGNMQEYTYEQTFRERVRLADERGNLRA